MSSSGLTHTVAWARRSGQAASKHTRSVWKVLVYCASGSGAGCWVIDANGRAEEDDKGEASEDADTPPALRRT